MPVSERSFYSRAQGLLTPAAKAEMVLLSTIEFKVLFSTQPAMLSFCIGKVFVTGLMIFILKRK